MIEKVVKVLPGSGTRLLFPNVVFNFDKLYKTMKSWFDDHDYDFHEKEHTEKDKPLGREILIKWVAEREVDDYAKFIIEVKFFIENFTEIEGANKCDLELKFWARVELDYKNAWQTNRLYKFLFWFRNNFLIRKKIENDYCGKLKEEVNELQEIAKNIVLGK